MKIYDMTFILAIISEGYQKSYSKLFEICHTLCCSLGTLMHGTYLCQDTKLPQHRWSEYYWVSFFNDKPSGEKSGMLRVYEVSVFWILSVYIVSSPKLLPSFVMVRHFASTLVMQFEHFINNTCVKNLTEPLTITVGVMLKWIKYFLA